MSEESLAELLIKIMGDATGAIASFGATTAAAKEMKEAINGHVEQLSQGFGEMKSQLLELAAVVGLAFGVEALKSFVEKSMESVVAIDNLSRRTGVQTEQLYGMKIMAEETGVAFDSVTMGLTRMERAIEEGSKGNEALEVTFARLGVNIEELKTMKPEEAMMALGDALNHVGSQAERTAIQMQLFGRGGPELTNFLRQGKEGLDEAAKKAEELGLAISKVDSAKVREASIAFEEIKTAVQAMGAQLVVAMSGPLMEFATWIKDQVLDVNHLKENTKDLVDGIIIGMGYAGNTLQIFKIAWLAIAGAAQEVATAIYMVIDVVVRQIALISNIVVNFGTLIKQTFELMTDALSHPWDTLKAATAVMVQFVSDRLFDLLSVAAKVALALNETEFANDLVDGMNKVSEASKSMHEWLTKGIDDKVKKDADALSDTLHHMFDIQEDGWVKKIDQLLSDSFDVTKKYAAELGIELHKPWSSEDIKTWLQQANAAVDAAAAHKKKVDSEEGGNNDVKQYQDGLKQKLADQTKYLNQERLQENKNYKQAIIDMKAAFAQEGTDQATQNAVLEQMKQQHEDTMANIAMTDMDKQLAWDKKTASEKLAFEGNILTQLGSLMQSSNREAFEVGKAAALAGAIVNTAAGVMNGFATLPPWLAWANAAAVVAMGAVQIGTISSTHFGGGGGGSSGSVPSMPSATPPPRNANGQNQGVTGRERDGTQLNITTSDSITQLGARAIGEAVNAFLAQGGKISGLHVS